MSNSEMLAKLAGAVENLDSKNVKPLVEQALASGMRPSDSPDQRPVGGHARGWARSSTPATCSCPRCWWPATCTSPGWTIVRPLLAAGGDDHILGTMIMGNIYGDVHTVGKQVAMPVFEASGIRVIDLGEDLNDEAFVEGIRKHKPQIVGFGTYMTSTFMHTKETVAAITKAGLRDQVKIICGGPAVDAEAARRMGADDASDDAWKGVEKIKRLLGDAR